jgi:hypothetical protein
VRKRLVGRVVFFDEKKLEPIVRRTLDKEPRARAQLWLDLAPPIESIAGDWRVTSRLHDSEEDRRNVYLSVMVRLEADESRRLLTCHELLQRQNGSASQWLRVLTVHSALRYMEQHPDHLGPGTKDDPGPRWADMTALPDDLADMLPESVRMIPAIAGREIWAYAERTLPPLQVQALRLWSMDYRDQEIADEMQLPDAHAAHKLVRAAHGRLRTRFAPGEEEQTFFRGRVTDRPEHVSYRR